MKVYKVLNNNVVVSLDNNGNETIVMGRGLGFKKREGDKLDIHLIEKQFSLQNKVIIPKFAELLANIPDEILAVSEIIIRHAKTILNDNVQDNLYLSLTDHINFAIERHKQGLDISNGILWELKKFYSTEYQIGLFALKTIQERLGIQLPEDEAGFITFHIINAQYKNPQNIKHNLKSITKIMLDILDIVKYHFHLEFNDNCLSYQRFITHLKFFAERILNQQNLSSQTTSLYELIRQKYTEAYQCTQLIQSYLTAKYHHSLTDDESLYLTIHIERLRNELTK